VTNAIYIQVEMKRILPGTIPTEYVPVSRLSIQRDTNISSISEGGVFLLGEGA
jgi:hypothetical protein